MSRAITTSPDTGGILDLIARQAAEVLEADIALVLVPGDGEGLKIRAVHGSDPERVRGFVSRIDGPAVGRLGDLLGTDSSAGIATAPIVRADSPGGLLAIVRRTGLSDDEREILSALADQASIALWSARLRDAGPIDQDRLSTHLAAMRRRLSSSLELKGIFEAVCWAARDLTQADGACFVLRSGGEAFACEENAILPLWKGSWSPVAKSVCGWSILHGEPMVVEDVLADERITIENYRDTFVRSLSIVPVRPPDPLGAIVVCWAERHRPSAREMSLLKALAEDAATAISNAQLYDRMKAAGEEAERRAEALVRLQEASVALTHDIESSLYDRVIERICQVTSAPQGVFWLLDESQPGGSFLVPQWRWGFPDDPAAGAATDGPGAYGRVPLDSERPIAQAARSGKLVAAPDLSKEPPWRIPGYLDRYGVRSMLAIPLRARGKLLGAVSLHWQSPDAGSCPATLYTAEVIANQIAAILDATTLVRDLSRANELKDEFLATLSHELRNPLNVIVGYSDILQRSPEVRRSADLREAARVIFNNAMAQARLVGDLLDLSRLQTGKLVFSLQPVSLAPAVADAIATVSGDAKKKGILLQVELAREPIIVEADPVRIQQVAWNLLNNAVKFTPEGGRVDVRLDIEGNEAKLVVEDTGQGIDPAFLPHVFTMFRQGEAIWSRRHGGLGIGLALVRQIVDQHGGRVEATSAGPGEGSRFTVWLPLRGASPAPETEPEPGYEGNVLAGLKILAIDDSRDTLRMLERLLKLEGATVATADNGVEGLKIAGELDFDLLICDISMPGMDGYEMLTELRMRTRNNEIPAIALTGFGQAEDVDRARSVGFLEHLTKPVRLEQLIEAVRRALPSR